MPSNLNGKSHGQKYRKQVTNIKVSDNGLCVAKTLT